MARKTVDVEFLREWVNRILDPEQCPELNEDNRTTAATILSGVLHETGNYKGFQFLNVQHVEDDDGVIVETIIPDETARRYY